jgi:hypothetical protein
MPRPRSIDTGILEAALAGLESHRQRIDEQLAAVRQMLGARGPGRPVAASADGPTTKTLPVRTKRKMSAAARKRIAAAQKKRWAKFRKQQAAANK